MKILILLVEIILFIVVSGYLYLFFNRNSIETSMTFVGIWVNKEYDYKKDGLQEFQISSWKEKIHGIFLDNHQTKTIYFFHGNGGPMPYYLNTIQFLWSLGYNVMCYDYPGYGKSSWYPLEENVYQFSKDFFEFMAKEKWLKLENIIVFWQSIGTWVGADFAFKNKVEKLILVSPLASRYDMSIKSFGFVLQKILFMKNSFDTYTKIANITIPTLIIHGNKDEVIPYSQWKKVFEYSGSEKKYFITLENFWHNGIFENFWNELQKPIKEFLEKWNLEKQNIVLK